MGTSKGYIPPTSPAWSQAKRAVSTYLRTPDADSRSYAMGRFATAMKSNVGAGQTRTFESSAARVLGLARSIASVGLDSALHSIGRDDLIGKTSDEIWSELIHEFTHAGATTEDALAADAISAALDNLQIDDLSKLGTLPPETLLKEFIKEYVIASFDFSFEERVTRGRTPAETERMLDDMHRYIGDTLDSDLTLDEIKTVDFTNLGASDIVKNSLEDAISIFERHYGEA